MHCIIEAAGEHKHSQNCVYVLHNVRFLIYNSKLGVFLFACTFFISYLCAAEHSQNSCSKQDRS